MDGNAEYNIQQHLSASKYAIDNWPTPVVFSPFEIGHAVITGTGLQDLPGGPGPDGHILRRVYHLHSSLNNGRHSWDQCACLYAVLGVDDGPATKYWKLSGPGTVTVHRDGRTTWTSDPDGLHQYKIKRRDPDMIAEEIESLMIAAGPAEVGCPDR